MEAMAARQKSPDAERPRQKRGLFLFPSKFRIAGWKNKTAGNGGVDETNAHARERS
jgi:hypothetical protein